jgi:hypothetical protein
VPKNAAHLIAALRSSSPLSTVRAVYPASEGRVVASPTRARTRSRRRKTRNDKKCTDSRPEAV